MSTRLPAGQTAPCADSDQWEDAAQQQRIFEAALVEALALADSAGQSRFEGFEKTVPEGAVRQDAERETASQTTPHNLKVDHRRSWHMAIFTHITIGTNDLEAARSFYDRALEPLGLKRSADMDKASIWGGEFFVLKPVDGNAASVGNGTTVSFLAPNRAAVDAFHAQALAAGGKDAGAPGPRTFAPNAYAAYVRDLDGHKVVAVTTAG